MLNRLVLILAFTLFLASPATGAEWYEAFEGSSFDYGAAHNINKVVATQNRLVSPETLKSTLQHEISYQFQAPQTAASSNTLFGNQAQLFSVGAAETPLICEISISPGGAPTEICHT